MTAAVTRVSEKPSLRSEYVFLTELLDTESWEEGLELSRGHHLWLWVGSTLPPARCISKSCFIPFPCFSGRSCCELEAKGALKAG